MTKRAAMVEGKKGKAGRARRAMGRAAEAVRKSVPRVALGSLVAMLACTNLDTTRVAGPKATLGDDFFGVLCDRVGASSLPEDLSGASYYGVCHYDKAGNYQDAVDESALPPPAGDKAKQARALSLAKLSAMARRRSDLIRALNAMMPDVMIDDPVTGGGAQIGLHDALLDFAQRLDPLYFADPYDANAGPLLPGSTRALSRMLSTMVDSDAAREAFSHIWGRRGYRPSPVGLGALRGALGYPGLRGLAKASLDVLGPNGRAVPQLQQLLAVGKQMLVASSPTESSKKPLTIDPALVQPSRPRTNLEVMASLLLSSDPTFAVNDSEVARYIAARDRRGFVLPLGNTPGDKGTVKAPFVDGDGDGYADVDASGRFIDASGAPLTLDPPFGIPGITSFMPDGYGRPENAPYQYLDTTRTLGRATLHSLAPLLDPTKYASDGDPAPWQSEHEALMYAMAGAYTLYGGREDAQFDFVNDVRVPMGQACDGCLQYSRFRGEDSPITLLAHALGQVIGDKDSDAILASFLDLLKNHEDVVARLVGAALRVREISLEHDKKAAMGLEPKAELAYATPLWDEMAQILARMTARPGLVKKAVEALADDAVITPHGAANHMGEGIAAFANYLDEYTYDPTDVNNPTVNLTVGSPSIDDPKSPVDWKAPRTGKNRSLLQRSLQVIHDARNARTCNKEGAVVNADVFGVSLTWPLIGSYHECELTAFDNEAIFYLDTNLPAAHPKRSQMVIMGALKSILDLGSNLGVDPDTVMQQSSGLNGLSLHPEAPAITRLLFFGASTDNYPNMPDADLLNQGGKTDTFIHGIIEPAGGVNCPRNANNVNTCPNDDETLRVRDLHTMFAWERDGFLEYLKPLIRVFADESCSSDESACDTTSFVGEQILVDLLDEPHYHWPGKDHGPECDPSGSKDTNPKYCSEAGVNRYEPILADALRTDLIPALHDFALAARDLSKITVARGPHAGETWSGTDVLEKVTRILFDQQYAADVGMVDRNGKHATTWVDGTPQQQLTPFTLFADALHAIDTTFTKGGDASRQAQWKRARSELVDQFLAVDGSGPGAKFKNRSFAKISVAALELLREQLNANCPNRETTGTCTWARHDIGEKVGQVLSGPLFAGIMDVQEAVRADDASRRELEKLLLYLFEYTQGSDNVQGTLASLSDLLQVLRDDRDLSPIFNAIASVSSPAADADGPGLADTTIRALKALTGDDYDRYHVLDTILPALVTPMDDGSGLSPLEIFVDVIAEIDRIDSSTQDPLVGDDYKFIFGSLRDFMTDKTRGLEQIYTIINNRPR